MFLCHLYKKFASYSTHFFCKMSAWKLMIPVLVHMRFHNLHFVHYKVNVYFTLCKVQTSIFIYLCHNQKSANKYFFEHTSILYLQKVRLFKTRFILTILRIPCQKCSQALIILYFSSLKMFPKALLSRYMIKTRIFWSHIFEIRKVYNLVAFHLAL